MAFSRCGRSATYRAYELDEELKKLETVKRGCLKKRKKGGGMIESGRGDKMEDGADDGHGNRQEGRQISSGTRREASFDPREHHDLGSRDSFDSFLEPRSRSPRFFEEGLPDAILKLDRRRAIPRPRHKNDVLVEIEASTVDKRDFMIRPGVRCTDSLPQGVETTGVDCIGRVVQLTTHARAIFGVSIDDRVAALYPFEYKSERNVGRNNQYALLDAAFVVTVPRNVDAAEAACMIRLYMTAFQSIHMGMHDPIDRYNLNLLKGHSVLVQGGNTELGQALIDLASCLGASQIFATATTEHHQHLKDLGAIPLGEQTFGWELFIAEKLSLVIVQEMPSSDDFDSFISLLDDSKGNMVYIQPFEPHAHDDIGIIAEDVHCDGIYLNEIAEKAKSAVKSAKFYIKLACTPQFLTYEGIWPSSRENQDLFKEDLRFLFSLLSEGNLKPNVAERICLEEVSGVQDRMELQGKQGTTVCLPFKTATETALYEKKASAPNVISPENSPRSQLLAQVKTTERNQYPMQSENKDRLGPSDDNSIVCENYESRHQEFASEFKYEADSGYIKYPTNVLETTHLYDGLSDFHKLSNNTQKMPNPRRNESPSSYSQEGASVHSNFRPNSSVPAHHLPHYWSRKIDDTMSPDNSPRSDLYASDFHDNSSMIGSVYASVESSTADHHTTVSDSVLKREPILEQNPPTTIQFNNKKSKRRQRAYQRQKEAKEKWRKAHQEKMDTKTDDDSCATSSPSSPSSISSYSEKSDLIHTVDKREARVKWRQARRNARMRSKANESNNVPVPKKAGLSAVIEVEGQSDGQKSKMIEEDVSDSSHLSSATISTASSTVFDDQGLKTALKEESDINNNIENDFCCPVLPQDNLQSNRVASPNKNTLHEIDKIDQHLQNNKDEKEEQSNSQQPKESVKDDFLSNNEVQIENVVEASGHNDSNANEDNEHSQNITPQKLLPSNSLVAFDKVEHMNKSSDLNESTSCTELESSKGVQFQHPEEKVVSRNESHLAKRLKWNEIPLLDGHSKSPPKQLQPRPTFLEKEMSQRTNLFNESPANSDTNTNEDVSRNDMDTKMTKKLDESKREKEAPTSPSKLPRWKEKGGKKKSHSEQLYANPITEPSFSSRPLNSFLNRGTPQNTNLCTQDDPNIDVIEDVSQNNAGTKIPKKLDKITRENEAPASPPEHPRWKEKGGKIKSHSEQLHVIPMADLSISRKPLNSSQKRETPQKTNLRVEDDSNLDLIEDVSHSNMDTKIPQNLDEIAHENEAPASPPEHPRWKEKGRKTKSHSEQLNMNSITEPQISSRPFNSFLDRETPQNTNLCAEGDSNINVIEDVSHSNMDMKINKRIGRSSNINDAYEPKRITKEASAEETDSVDTSFRSLMNKWKTIDKKNNTGIGNGLS